MLKSLIWLRISTIIPTSRVVPSSIENFLSEVIVRRPMPSALISQTAWCFEFRRAYNVPHPALIKSDLKSRTPSSKSGALSNIRNPGSSGKPSRFAPRFAVNTAKFLFSQLRPRVVHSSTISSMIKVVPVCPFSIIVCSPEQTMVVTSLPDSNVVHGKTTLDSSTFSRISRKSPDRVPFVISVSFRPSLRHENRPMPFAPVNCRRRKRR